MAKAMVSRRFDATDVKKGVSRRIEPSDKPQTLPAWVVDAGVAAGAAERVDSNAAGAAEQKGD